MEPNQFYYDSYGWEITMPYSMTSNDMVSASSAYRRNTPRGDLRLSPEAPLSEAVLNVNSALNLEPGPGLLQSTTREQPFETGTAACVRQLDQPGGPQLVDCLGWNQCRESCVSPRGPAHPALPPAPDAFCGFYGAGHPLSQPQPSPPARQAEVLPAAPELEAARGGFPATGPDQSFGLVQSSCCDQDYWTVDAELMRQLGELIESQQVSQVQPEDGQANGAFVEAPAHRAVPLPPSMVAFDGGARGDLRTRPDRWPHTEWYGLQQDVSLGHWPILDMRPDLVEGRCLDLPETDKIGTRIDFQLALTNGDVSSSDLWRTVMDEMSCGAVADDKAAAEKSVGQPECGSDTQHYKHPVGEVLATRSPGPRESRKGHCDPQAPSGPLRSAGTKSDKATRLRRQARRKKRLIPRKPSIWQPKPGDSEYVRVKTITDQTGETYTWHRRDGRRDGTKGSWHDGNKKRVDAEVILSSKPWSSMMVLRAVMEEVTMHFNKADANYVGEVGCIGTLSLSDEVAVVMCKDPDGHNGFLAEWDVERARAS